jgi:integrase/recombinase XerD
MPPKSLKELFFDYLRNVRCVSGNTFMAYAADIDVFLKFIKDDASVISANGGRIEEFKEFLKDSGRAASSVSRALSSVRAFYSFLQKNSIVQSNPAKTVKNDRVIKEDIEFLTADEVDKLIACPKGSDEKSVRDRVMLEMMYATGMKVSELISLNVSDFNQSLSLISCGDTASPSRRSIPLYPKAKKMIAKYISGARGILVNDVNEQALFVNINGTRMTRQGIWKIIKSYADEAGISKEITPKMLRNSFALHLLENGADVKQLRDVLGHSDISTTNVYVDFLKKKMSNSLISLHPHA